MAYSLVSFDVIPAKDSRASMALSLKKSEIVIEFDFTPFLQANQINLVPSSQLIHRSDLKMISNCFSQ